MLKNDAYMNIDSFGNIYIKDIIIYYDKPLTFSCVNDSGQLFLASCINIDEMEEWLFVPLSEARLILGLKGNIQAYKMFSQPEGGFLWKVILSASQYTDGSAIKILPISLTDDDLPDKDIVYNVYELNEFNIKDKEVDDIVRSSVVERREIIDISLEPKNSHIHEIDAEALSKVLDMTQSLINIIAHKKGMDARVPKDIKDDNKLKVAGTFAASFGIRLKSNNLADILNESKLQETLDIFMNMLESKSNVENLTDILKELNPSVSVQYKNLLKFLEKEEVSFKTKCAFPNNKYRKIVFTEDEIKESLKSFEKDIKELEKEQKLKGYFVAINILKKTFTFITENEDQLQGMFDSSVNINEYRLLKKATVNMKIITRLDDFILKESTSYTLLSLVYD